MKNTALGRQIRSSIEIVRQNYKIWKNYFLRPRVNTASYDPIAIKVTHNEEYSIKTSYTKFYRNRARELQNMEKITF
jgi:hypothetical protein